MSARWTNPTWIPKCVVVCVLLSLPLAATAAGDSIFIFDRKSQTPVETEDADRKSADEQEPPAKKDSRERPDGDNKSSDSDSSDRPE